MLVIASVEPPKPSISSPTQPRTRFQSQNPSSNQFPVAKLPHFRKSGSSRKTPAFPAHTCVFSAHTSVFPTHTHIITHMYVPRTPKSGFKERNLLKTFAQSFRSASRQPGAASPQPKPPASRQPSAKQPSLAQHPIPKIRFQREKPAQNFRSKRFAQNLLAPKPLTISISP